MRSYRIFFVAGTEDLILRKNKVLSKTAREELVTKNLAKKEKLLNWIEGRKAELGEKREIAMEKIEIEKKLVEVVEEKKEEIIVVPEVVEKIETVVEMVVDEPVLEKVEEKVEISIL